MCEKIVVYCYLSRGGGATRNARLFQEIDGAHAETREMLFKSRCRRNKTEMILKPREMN